MLTAMDPATPEQLNALTIRQIAARMDSLLETARSERYNVPLESVSLYFGQELTVSDFVSTKVISQKPLTEQRVLVHLLFGFLVQMALCEVAGGISNRELYNDKFDASQSWRSPAFWLRYGALRQYGILASRTAMDIFMDLLYAIDRGNRLPSSKSKFKKFRNWLRNVENPFVYFAHVLIAAHRFDRKFRTPEAHGASRFPGRLLSFQPPESAEINEQNHLLNVLVNVWQPLQTILDGERPNFGQLLEGSAEWLKTYVSGSAEEIEEVLDAMFSEVR